MTRPKSVEDAPRAMEAGVKEKDDFDETSDLCDFGYALAGGIVGATTNAAAERLSDGSV